MLTHGAGGTHAAWFQQVPTLAANGFRVITWDCGIGNSTFTSSVHGTAAAVADMAAVLDATGTPGAHLVGQSMADLPLPPLWVTVILNVWLVGPHPDLRLIHAAGIWTDSWQIVAIDDSAQRPQPVSQIGQVPLGHRHDRVTGR